ncbi:Sensory box histidine kinase/response regulator [hydrothermal vent metagenome]|uniref:Sensory box histidine kinase/response regulator n=1 Tax=hydrothermal vent metagenome TaxID=652676 RepID=A0A3B0RWJ9_9ZZZZ
MRGATPLAFLNIYAGPIRQAAEHLRPRAAIILSASVLFVVLGWLTPDEMIRFVVLIIAAILAMAAFWITVFASQTLTPARNAALTLAEFIVHDNAPSIVTGLDGKIICHNRAAGKDFDMGAATTLAGALQSTLANPGAILYRMGIKAAEKAAAQEDVITRNGHVHIAVHRAGPDQLLWRVEKSSDQPQRNTDPMPLPMLTVGRNDAILSMNRAARELVGERAPTLDRICRKLPLRSGQLNDISTREGEASCLVVELEGTAGRREVFLLPGVAATERKPDGWTFFDELPVPLLKLTRSGDVQLSNQPARDLLGVESCAGKVLSDFMEGLGRSIPDWLEDAAVGRGTVHSEFLQVKRKDKEVFLQVTLNRAMEEGETVLIAVLNDATELKSLEAQFVQSQKMQAIGQLAGGVAHDFNNLLTAISGHCDLLLLRHDQSDLDYSDLTQINQNANRAAALVGQLLAYSRKQTLRPEVMDLRNMLSDLTHLLNRLVGEKVTLTLSHDPKLSAIRADKRQLEQVLMNLVVNARDAMKQGGDIRIETENLILQEPLRRDRAVVAPGKYVSVKVIDQGMGIPADKLQKVFEPFFTTKRVGEGTGLGLSTAYGIIKQTGGFIFVDSKPGEGTSFQLLLPAHDAIEQVQARTPEVKPMPDEVEGVILLVEDEAPVRAFASRALQLRGFTVLEAESAEDALELLRDEDLKIDVFVTDVIMPGIDGPTWVKQARKIRPDVSVVFMSGYAEETFGNSQSKIPNSVFLPKPFSLTALTETVQGQLNSKPAPVSA